MLYIIRKIYLKIERSFGEITLPKVQMIYKEINFFYNQVLPAFFSNINKERYLTISSIENIYSNLPLVFRIAFAFLFTSFVIYCIMLITSYIYYFIIIH